MSVPSTLKCSSDSKSATRAWVNTTWKNFSATGDTICGRTVIGVGQPAINRGGAVAFAAWFSDRSSAIMLARPMIVPPPESQNSPWYDHQ
jgi:hypothetical protein